MGSAGRRPLLDQPLRRAAEQEAGGGVLVRVQHDLRLLDAGGLPRHHRRHVVPGAARRGQGLSTIHYLRRKLFIN